ncbi:glycosyltransferase [Maritalea porphyrae]|uniref:glycosyltransferase n=1 Tax=Maritalea porphyrae TaxID=880732 RepID=UPI0022B05B62|nr:glycosyltransferase [Maritalea porphyrae]MCZ4271943.1 glycosyltransferase [Maritalea porphyrae]
MKVLHFYKTHKPDTIGGVEQFIDHVAKNVAPKGVQTRVLAMSANAASEPIQMDNYEVHQTQSQLDFASTPMSYGAIDKFKKHALWADVIHLHYPYPFADLAYLASGTTKPTIVTYHSDIVRQKLLSAVYEPLKKRFLKKVDRLVATSPNYVDTSKTLAQFPNKTSVIPLGLEDTLIEGEAFTLPEKWRPQLGERYFLFVGVLRYYKGLKDLVMAAKSSHYPIAIAGDGPERAGLEALAKTIGADNVHFLGQVSAEEKSALLKNCTGFVFPSNQRSEAFGVSLIEAAMFGKPMITCEIGTGTSYVNLANVTGLICPHSEPNALRWAMDQLWSDQGLALELGRNARARFQAHFTAEQMASAYLGVYKELFSTA